MTNKIQNSFAMPYTEKKPVQMSITFDQIQQLNELRHHM